MTSKSPYAKAALEELRALPYVVMVFCALFFGGSGVDIVREAYDDYILPKPWVDPVIEIKATSGQKPDIFYGARAKVPVSGRWVATVEVGDFRLDSHSGMGSYRVGSNPRLWSWQEFFGDDLIEPSVPYRVCVFYDLSTRSGAQDITETFCSREYDPRPKE